MPFVDKLEEVRVKRHNLQRWFINVLRSHAIRRKIAHIYNTKQKKKEAPGVGVRRRRTPSCKKRLNAEADVAARSSFIFLYFWVMRLRLLCSV